MAGRRAGPAHVCLVPVGQQRGCHARGPSGPSPREAARVAAHVMEEPSAENPQATPTAPEHRDADGLPLDREPTLDDVRGGANHFKLAVGCSALVVLLIVAFWVLRVMMSR